MRQKMNRKSLEIVCSEGVWRTEIELLFVSSFSNWWASYRQFSQQRITFTYADESSIFSALKVLPPCNASALIVNNDWLAGSGVALPSFPVSKEWVIASLQYVIKLKLIYYIKEIIACNNWFIGNWGRLQTNLNLVVEEYKISTPWRSFKRKCGQDSRLGPLLSNLG